MQINQILFWCDKNDSIPLPFVNRQALLPVDEWFRFPIVFVAIPSVSESFKAR